MILVALEKQPVHTERMYESGCRSLTIKIADYVNPGTVLIYPYDKEFSSYEELRDYGRDVLIHSNPEDTLNSLVHSECVIHKFGIPVGCLSYVGSQKHLFSYLKDSSFLPNFSEFSCYDLCDYTSFVHVKDTYEGLELCFLPSNADNSAALKELYKRGLGDEDGSGEYDEISTSSIVNSPLLSSTVFHASSTISRSDVTNSPPSSYGSLSTSPEPSSTNEITILDKKDDFESFKILTYVSITIFAVIASVCCIVITLICFALQCRKRHDVHLLKANNNLNHRGYGYFRFS